jgi:hypothetical protein
MLKIKLIFAVIVLSFFFGCHSNDQKKEETVHVTPIDTVSASVSGDTARTIVNPSMIWTVESGNSQNEKLKGPEKVLIDTFSSHQLIDLLNKNFPDIQLDLVKISNDTIYVKIPDNKRLANEMGNTGAENYLASTTFTLTELKNIKYVNIAMKPGDHAEPGVYSRDDFKRLR